MGWLDIHKGRMDISNDNIGSKDEYIQDTEIYLNDTFNQSPSYQIVRIDGIEHGVRIVNNRKYQTANEFEQNLVLLKPNTFIERGSYMTYPNELTKKQETWLIVFYHYHRLYPKAYARYCNKTLNFKNGTSLPCVVSNKISSSAFIQENEQMTLPKDSLAVYVKATKESIETVEGDRFVIDNLAYQVQSINISMNTEDGIGVVEMSIMKVPKKQDEVTEVEIVDSTTNKENGWDW